jgi:hypothetical protein
MSFDVLSAAPVLPDRRRLPDNIKVTLNDVEIRDASLVVLRLGNVGRADIKSASFDNARPIRFKFGESKVLDASVVTAKGETLLDVSRDNLDWDPTMANTVSQVDLKPFLWHHGDWVRLNFLIGGPVTADSISVEAWIEGVNEIKGVVRPTSELRSFRANFFITVVIGLVYFAFGALATYAFAFLLR